VARELRCPKGAGESFSPQRLQLRRPSPIL
jgi:hypothetical protein